MTPVLVILVALLVLNVASWAAFRLDKRRARRNLRRIPERTLHRFAALGPFGALSAMYLHHHRHKVDKRRFAFIVWLFGFLWIAATIAWFTLR